MTVPPFSLRGRGTLRAKRVSVLLAILMTISPEWTVLAQKPAPTSTAKPAATATPPAGTNADVGWPRTVAMNHGTAVLYQPQVESWAGQKQIVAWAAVAYTPTGAKEPALGTIKLESETKVALDDHLVSFEPFTVTEYNFKSLSPEQVKTMVAEVRAIPTTERVIDLARVTAYVTASPLNVKDVEGLKADPPKIFSSSTPAALLTLDGEPVWSPIQSVDLRYAVNTNWDLFEHTPTKTFYLRDEQSWLQAAVLAGPWTAVSKLPDSFAKLPADENWKDVKAAVPGKKLNAKNTPKVFVSYDAAELIELTGPPSYLAVQGVPTLLWVNNTESDLFRMGKTGDFYFLVAGRWFKSASLEGPWTFATPTLPDEFKRIPVEHPRSRVLASVPRTARVNKKELKAPDVAFQGTPQFKAIEGTKGLEQAVNTDKDIIKFGDLYYMCFQGVWFMSRAATGPWEVTSSVPKEIYTIPTSSPVHHVTYVTVEDSSDEWVTFAYVAAYTGLMIGWGCAVWGTGWYYPPHVFYGGLYPAYFYYPRTYGMGAWYNPHTGTYGRGYGVYGPYGGAGFGAAYNPRTGTYARGAAAYGPYGSARAAQAWNPRTGTYAQTRQGSNVYGNWGSSSVQRGDSWAQTAHTQNYATGRTTVGGRTSEGGGIVSTAGRGGSSTVARTGSGDIYAGHDGNVYRKGDNGQWEQHGSGNTWNTVNTDQAKAQAQAAGSQARDRASTAASSGAVGQLDRDSTARASGSQRAASRGGWQSSGASRAGAGSYRGGGGGGRRRR